MHTQTMRALCADQMLSVNPFNVLILVPTFSWIVYPAAERLGLRPTPLRLMSAGMVLTGVSFLVVAALQVNVSAWQSGPYGDVCG